ncbi:MBL fold metallo-hydrolase [Superficieibacter sp.]|uniref:MBL fold metallo-hydrolase n=1 Tax=Superficieibacter sp. TaxID=2303322 RepID=UPI0028A87A3D|nr:MBL fold metallo-hydrolase [Superficieibacter sp.]
MIKHNKIISALILTGALLQSATGQAADVGPQHVLAQPAGGYSIQVGDARVTSFTDGTVPQDLYPLLQHTTRQHIDGLLAKSFQANPVELSINAFLIEYPGHKILVDTGVGQLFGPGLGGRLVESLATQGIRPQDITDVLLTHAHSDHEGGLVKDGQRVFTNASVYVGKPDVDFFFNNENQKKTGYDQQHFDFAQRALGPYLKAGKLRTFSASAELLPGITGTVHPGHTPGSAFYTLQRAGERIVFIGDIIHVAPVQFAEPAITITYDENPAQAATVRQTAFADFAKEGELIAAPHLPWPGIGHIADNARGGYNWIPVNYTNRAAK